MVRLIHCVHAPDHQVFVYASSPTVNQRPNGWRELPIEQWGRALVAHLQARADRTVAGRLLFEFLMFGLKEAWACVFGAALLAMILAEYANEAIDVCKLIRMMLVHDLVEIDAGDTFIYDDAGNASKASRESAAADRIFGLLPADQRNEIQSLWEEFEARTTAEAKFAKAMDRLMPVLHNYFTHGRSWREHGITQEQALAKNKKIAEGAEPLWDLARSLIVEALR